MSKLYSGVLVVLVVCTFVTARSILGNENAATENRNKREKSLLNSLIRSRMRRQLDFMSGIPNPASQFMNMTSGANPASQFMNMTGAGNMIPSQAGSFFNTSSLPINQIPGIGGNGGNNNGGNAAGSTEAPAAGSRKKRQLDFMSGIPNPASQFMNMTSGANPASQFMNMTGAGNMIPSQAGSFFNASGLPINQIPGIGGNGGNNNGGNAAGSTEAPAAGSRKKRQFDLMTQFMNMTSGANPASQFMNMTGGGNMIPSQAGSCFNASGLPINQIPGMQGIGGGGGSTTGGNAGSSTEAPAAGSRKKRQLDFMTQFMNMTSGGNPASQFMNMTGAGNMIPSQAGSCFNASGLPINQIPGMQGIGGGAGSTTGENAGSSTEAPAAGSRRRREAPSSAVDTDGGERRRRDLIDELPVGANPAGIASSMQSIEHPPDSEDSLVIDSNPISGFAEGVPSGSQPGGIASAMQPPPNNYLEGDF